MPNKPTYEGLEQRANMRNHTTISLFTLLQYPFFLVFLVLLSCSPSPETTLERVRSEGVVRVGYANDIPFAYITKAERLTGEAPEIARKVLAKMGINGIEGVLVEFGSLIPALKAGRFDMISAMIFITPERCKEINFSEPTCGLRQGFFVKEGNPLNLHSYEDVAKHSKAIFCAMTGTLEVDYARSVGIPTSRTYLVPDTPSGIEAIKQGKADALAVAGLTIQILADKMKKPGVERAEPFTGPIINGREAKGYGAFGFRKADTDFLREFNKHLKEFVGTPEHLETVKPFGITDLELPGDITAAELCSGN